ncbi:hypothetical protein BDV36DRAFT_31294 [Aspergillus pseudocaelatus]|uniref:Zn(2)-C6 fungal-type domain-containing protein n=1 Tax=Aspergillus pseudocaelatus TaxID=1825620 RepID=A0ABQ6WXM2_9EURO|nr:hypothetical protein BDV36DRAFT_31294 [Aspergillus pseudocaelatus]
MVRSVTRSRDCAQCLRRKIKCDENRPECSQCRRIRKPCPGVYKGLFMVHSSRTVQGTRPSTELPSICTSGASFLAKPSYQPLFEQVLVSTFVASFSLSSSGQVSHDSWTKYLSSWITSSETLGWSIRATTLLFYAQKSNQEALYPCTSRPEILRCPLPPAAKG